ncbi:MAG: hypothetical protein GY830_01290 [Bacteroidetes bacterium]|nr:hypothetical protein [Bacteroidota bacterium]
MAFLGIILRNLILGLLLNKHGNFENCLTIGDYMEKIYNSKIKMITGFLCLIYAIYITAMQLMIIGDIFNFFFNINRVYPIILIGIILSLYSSYGGIKSVVITDFFQFLILAIIIPFISTLLVKHIGGYKTLFLSIPKEKFKIFKHDHFYYYLSYFLLWSIFPEKIVNPAFFQRILLAKNKKQLRDQFFISSVIRLIFGIVIMIISFCTFKIYSNVNPKIAFFSILKNILSPNIKILSIIALLSILMSTADSLLNSAGLIFTNDIIKPFTKKINLRYIRIATFILGIVSILISINCQHTTKLIINALKISIPILMFPLIAGIINLKVHKYSFYFGILGVIFTNICLEQIFNDTFKILIIPISIMINIICFMTVNLIRNNGIVFYKNNLEEKKLWIPSMKQIIFYLNKFFPTPKKIFNYSKSSVLNYGSNNILFGIFCCLNFTLPYFLWDHDNLKEFNLMTKMRIIGGIMAALLLIKNQWKDFLKKFYPLFWHITLIYCLPFITTMMLLLTKGAISWLINIGTSIFFLILLVNTEVFLIILPLGIGAAIFFYSFYIVFVRKQNHN